LLENINICLDGIALPVTSSLSLQNALVNTFNIPPGQLRSVVHIGANNSHTDINELLDMSLKKIDTELYFPLNFVFVQPE
jgi:hypothetical protein